MICKYCGAQYAGNRCPSCGKVIPLVKRSTEIDILMSGTPLTPPKPPEKTFDQGVKEGYQRGLKVGYDNGYKEGRSSLPRPQPKPNYKRLAIVCAALLLLVSSTVGIVSGMVNYNRGKSDGKAQGQQEGINIARATYEPLMEEAFEEGKHVAEATYEPQLTLYQTQLDEAEDRISELTATATPAASVTPSSQELILTAEEIKDVQRRLNELSYKDYDGKKLTEDGIWGPRTEFAIKVFQRDVGLPETGIVDVLTYQLLFPNETEQENTETNENSGINENPVETTIVTETPAVSSQTPTPGVQATPTPTAIVSPTPEPTSVNPETPNYEEDNEDPSEPKVTPGIPLAPNDDLYYREF